jgi:Zn ribbon nucleic-acid-binding protein
LKMNFLIITLMLLGLGGVAWYTIHDLHPLERPETWQLVYEPGKLSKAHSFLSHQCTACHSPVKGVTTVGCATCHASNQLLLKHQSTAFHANITSCKECHREHQGGKMPPLLMDHAAFAKIGVDIEKSQTPSAHGSPNKKIKIWRETSIDIARNEPISSRDSPIVSKLNCVGCHGNQDRHQKLFGASCLACHSTHTWRIPEYHHPSVNSRECVQCHQAPPSHYMGHFQMFSMEIAGKPRAQVNQCFLCHRTTSWNDIQGVGWYKHH